MIFLIGSISNADLNSSFEEKGRDINDIITNNTKVKKYDIFSKFIFTDQEYSNYFIKLSCMKLFFFFIFFFIAAIYTYLKTGTRADELSFTKIILFFIPYLAMTTYFVLRFWFIKNKDYEENILSKHCFYMSNRFFNLVDHRFYPETTLARDFLNIGNKFHVLSNVIKYYIDSFVYFIGLLLIVILNIYFGKDVLINGTFDISELNLSTKDITINITMSYIFYFFIFILSLQMFQIIFFILNYLFNSSNNVYNQLNESDIISMIFLLKNRNSFSKELQLANHQKLKSNFLKDLILNVPYKILKAINKFFIKANNMIVFCFNLCAIFIIIIFIILRIIIIRDAGAQEGLQTFVEKLLHYRIFIIYFMFLLIYDHFTYTTNVGENEAIDLLNIIDLLHGKPAYNEDNMIKLKSSDKIVGILARDASIYYYNEGYGFFSILSELNLDLTESTFIIGKSGIGKTTLLNALYKSVASTGLYFEILSKDGKKSIIPLNKIKKESIQRRIKYGRQLLNYPMSTLKIKDVIKDVYFIEDEEGLKIIKDILRICGLISSLDYSFYDKPIGEQGSGLLYREQRIFSLAVAVAQSKLDKNTNIFLGDEVLDYLNQTQKKEILKYLKDYLFLIIEHRITEGKQTLIIKSPKEFVIKKGENHVS